MTPQTNQMLKMTDQQNAPPPIPPSQLINNQPLNHASFSNPSYPRGTPKNQTLSFTSSHRGDVLSIFC